LSLLQRSFRFFEFIIADSTENQRARHNLLVAAGGNWMPMPE
jgi:hypothetical protein